MSDTDDGTPPGADVTFVQYLLPALRSGGVTVTAAQAVTIGDPVQTFATALQLSVAGPRYRLEPGTVASVFPPPGSQGEFTSVLPHVVLASPTLPWQRTPSADTPAPVAGAAAATWLAVLPFCALDPPPVPRETTVGELAAAGTTFFPDLPAEDGERDEDPVTVIDVAAALFAAVAPSLDDLDWLAHVRQVDVREKPVGDAPATSEYGVVIGNRLGTAGQATTAFLVSLEGWGPYLPAADGTPSPL
ncbi:MAG TPA: hypothetical protein VHG28_14940, partial [Longimicrobiaceae bacterium]|nr:hypothetical protein [Longimicrobiaceae bacterium]